MHAATQKYSCIAVCVCIDFVHNALTFSFSLFFSGSHQRQLGLSASSLLVWLTIELLIIYLGLFLAQVTSQLSWMDLLAYCTYKYTRWVWF